MTPEQLKASILQRAMEGKLVSQNPNDEPASELLKRIKAEKEKLISEGKIKRDKKETEIFRGDDGKHYEKFADGSTQEIDVPYDIPDTWEWVRLGRAISLLSGRDLNKSNYFDGKVGDTPYITGASNFSNGLVNTNRYTNHPTVLSYKGDLLITVKGTIGELAFNYFQKAHIARQIMAIQSTHLNLVFLKYQLQQLLPNIKLQAQSMIPGISRGTLLALLIPLPPLSEQQRIVEAIESALEKVDEYAESYNRLEQLDKEFPDKLKKSILQYAMQGKLVDQDPNDESVEVLLEKIRAEKQKLFEEGKIKKKDLEISIVSQGDDNSYYEQLPRNWMFSTLDSVSNLYTGNSINATEKKKYFSGVDGINYIATKDVNFDNTINYDNGIRIPDNYLSKFKISYFNSVLLCLEGGSAGRKIGLLKQDVCFGNKLCNLSFYYGENKFLYYFLQSPQFLSDFQKNKSGIIGGVSIKNLGNIPIPILPINEQNRITQKVEKLFEKVNQF